jgi:hypothetical protein
MSSFVVPRMGIDFFFSVSIFLLLTWIINRECPSVSRLRNSRVCICLSVFLCPFFFFFHMSVNGFFLSKHGYVVSANVGDEGGFFFSRFVFFPAYALLYRCIAFQDQWLIIQDRRQTGKWEYRNMEGAIESGAVPTLFFSMCICWREIAVLWKPRLRKWLQAPRAWEPAIQLLDFQVAVSLRWIWEQAHG